MEPRNKGYLEWEIVKEKASQLKVLALSSHSLRIPSDSTQRCMFVHLIRKPHDRFISAWKFETKYESFRGTFTEYLENKVHTANLQSKLLVEGSNDELSVDDIKLQEFYLYLRHRPNVFLGVVERYDESMTVLEQVINQNYRKIDLSYPSALNTSAATGSESGMNAEIPHYFTRLDTALHELANTRLDLYISTYPNFSELLSNFQARCQAKRGEKQSIPPKIKNKNWYFVG